MVHSPPHHTHTHPRARMDRESALGCGPFTSSARCVAVRPAGVQLLRPGAPQHAKMPDRLPELHREAVVLDVGRVRRRLRTSGQDNRSGPRALAGGACAAECRVTLDSLVSRYDSIIDSATRFGVAACFAVRGLFRRSRPVSRRVRVSWSLRGLPRRLLHGARHVLAVAPQPQQRPRHGRLRRHTSKRRKARRVSTCAARAIILSSARIRRGEQPACDIIPAQTARRARGSTCATCRLRLRLRLGCLF